MFCMINPTPAESQLRDKSRKVPSPVNTATDDG